MADDDAEDCFLVRDAFVEAGWPCDFYFVRDGEELFDYLRHEGEYVEGRNSPPPDLILLDLKMPRKDGRETIRDLKADPRFRSIPVIALTAQAMEGDREKTLAAGCLGYITKPIDTRTFAQTITLFLSAQRS